jgi:3-oxoacyl-[acyl-carrier-protein] synthase-3
MMNFGIAGLATSLGEPCDIAEWARMHLPEGSAPPEHFPERLFRADDATGATDLAVDAAHEALDRAGVQAAELDLIVLAMTGVPEYLYWDPAAALHGRLGATRAEAIWLNQACSSAVSAFDLVAGKFAVHRRQRNALIVGVSRVCEPYWNRMSSSAAVTSDGATAAVLVRGHARWQWLATETITDGRYADVSLLASGGAAVPFGVAPGLIAPVAGPVEATERLFGRDMRALIRFLHHCRDGRLEVLRRACESGGIDPEAISYLIYLNANPKAMRDLSKQLEIPLDRTNAEFAATFGHFGPADQLMALERSLTQGQLTPGEFVALLSEGSGMHWSCTLLCA